MESIDWLRGFVMVIMALDHVRDFFARSGQDPMSDPDLNFSLFATRWVTHLCAPTFVLLAGLSAGLMATRRSKPELSRFLLTRGLWLIVLDATMVSFAWKFNFSSAPASAIMGVLWAIGVGMILLSGLLYLPKAVILSLGVLIIAASGWFDAVFPQPQNQAVGNLWLGLHRQLMLDVSGFRIGIAYPVLAWSALMACGYGLAPVFSWGADRRQRLLLALGAALLLTFLLLRASHLYGDANPWELGPDLKTSVIDFLNVSKYPPSLLFLLTTIGIALPLLALAERHRWPLHQAMVTIGRVPLFYYLTHLYVIHLTAWIVSILQGLPATAWLNDPFTNRPEGFGFSLPVVYLVWLGIVGALYPACRWFARIKREHPSWWMSYL